MPIIQINRERIRINAFYFYIFLPYNLHTKPHSQLNILIVEQEELNWGRVGRVGQRRDMGTFLKKKKKVAWKPICFCVCIMKLPYDGTCSGIAAPTRCHGLTNKKPHANNMLCFWSYLPVRSYRPSNITGQCQRYWLPSRFGDKTILLTIPHT